MDPFFKQNRSRQPLPLAAGRIVLLVVFCLLPFLLAAAPAQDGPPPITYERYDVTLQVQGDGSFIVREIQQVRFDGEFRTAFAEIPTELTESIKNVRVYELSGETQVQYRARSSSPAGEGEPGTFSTTQEGNALYVDWTYEPTQPGDVRTFVVEYQVFGGLWIYAEGDILEIGRASCRERV